MRAARLAAAITLPALALLPATATAARAASYTGDGSSPITVNAAGSTSPDGTTLVLDPASAAVPVSASGCTEQPSTVRWVLYPNDTQMPVGEGDIASTASDGTWSTTIDVAAQVAAWKVSDPAASSWTLGVSCDGYQGQHSTALMPVLMSADAAAGATDASTVAAGAVLRVSAHGLNPGESAIVTLAPTSSGARAVQLGTATATSGGSVGADLVLPASTAAGTYTLTVAGTDSAQGSSRPLTVVAAGTATTTTSGTAAGTTSGAASGTGSTNEQVSTSTAQQARPAAADTAARSTTSASHRGALAHTGAAVVPLAISAVGILVVGVFLARRARRS